MRLARNLAFSALILSVASAFLSAAPVIPGLHANHSLKLAGQGRVLISQLGCAACHQDEAALPFARKGGPDLKDVGSRVSPDFLRRFIAEPNKAQPGVAMPDLMSGKSAAERAEAAEAITHFLNDKASGAFSRGPAGKGDPSAGKTLYHEIG